MGPLRWRRAATDSEPPPSDAQAIAYRGHLKLRDDTDYDLPVRDPRWGLIFEFGAGGGGTDLATVPYNGSTSTLSAGDGLAFSLGLMWTPLWLGDRLGAGVSGTLGYKGVGVGDKGSEASIGRGLSAHRRRPPASAPQPAVAPPGPGRPRQGIWRLVLGRREQRQDFNAKLGAFAEGGFYYIFDIWTAPEHRGELRAALSLTFRYTKLTYTTNAGSLDGRSLMVFTTYYYNP